MAPADVSPDSSGYLHRTAGPGWNPKLWSRYIYLIFPGFAPQAGIEPATYGLTVRRSNRLSY